MLKILFDCAFILFFLMIDLYILLNAVIAQAFSPSAELAIHTGITTNETKADIGTHPVTAETKINDCSM